MNYFQILVGIVPVANQAKTVCTDRDRRVLADLACFVKCDQHVACRYITDDSGSCRTIYLVPQSLALLFHLLDRLL